MQTGRKSSTQAWERDQDAQLEAHTAPDEKEGEVENSLKKKPQDQDKRFLFTVENAKGAKARGRENFIGERPSGAIKTRRKKPGSSQRHDRDFLKCLGGAAIPQILRAEKGHKGGHAPFDKKKKNEKKGDRNTGSCNKCSFEGNKVRTQKDSLAHAMEGD